MGARVSLEEETKFNKCDIVVLLCHEKLSCKNSLTPLIVIFWVWVVAIEEQRDEWNKQLKGKRIIFFDLAVNENES